MEARSSRDGVADGTGASLRKWVTRRDSRQSDSSRVSAGLAKFIVKFRADVSVFSQS